MGSVFKIGRFKTKQGFVKLPVLQFEDLPSAIGHYGEGDALIILNRGLKSTVAPLIRQASEEGQDMDQMKAASLEHRPQTKLKLSRGQGRRPKGPGRLAKDALKSGKVSPEALAAFLASQGVTP